MPIEVLRPNSDSETGGVTGSCTLSKIGGSSWWSLIDEVTADGDTTSIRANYTIGSCAIGACGIDYLCGIQTQASPIGSVNSVKVFFRGKATGSCSDKILGTWPNIIAVYMKISGSYYNSWYLGVPNEYIIFNTSSYVNREITYTVNPVTLAPWTASDIASLVVGNYFLINANTTVMHVTQLYVTLDYNLPADGAGAFLLT